jgi:hypothetical protein
LLTFGGGLTIFSGGLMDRRGRAESNHAVAYFQKRGLPLCDRPADRPEVSEPFERRLARSLLPAFFSASSRSAVVLIFDVGDVIERVTYTKGPGDDEDWKTPSRPSKKAKTKHDKTVNWDIMALFKTRSLRSGTLSVPARPSSLITSSSLSQLTVLSMRRDGQVCGHIEPLSQLTTGQT